MSEVVFKNTTIDSDACGSACVNEQQTCLKKEMNFLSD